MTLETEVMKFDTEVVTLETEFRTLDTHSLGMHCVSVQTLLAGDVK